MLMNRAETVLVNSPPRRWLQRFYETRVLLRFGGRLLPGARALEIGCGSGYGSQLVLERFGAASVYAVDLDPVMIERAGRRLARFGDRVRLARGSATDLRAAVGAEDGGYDAVFYFEEVTAHALARPIYRRLFDHPSQDRFTAEQFLDELARHGLVVLGSRTRIWGDYLLGVAAKPVPAGSDH